MNKENKGPANSVAAAQEVPDPVPCKFEELREQFLIQREIGRGSYGVVFKAIRNE